MARNVLCQNECSHHVWGHQFEVAKNVSNSGVREKCAPGPRGEAYYFKSHALTIGASISFQSGAVRKTLFQDKIMGATRVRARILILCENWSTHVAK